MSATATVVRTISVPAVWTEEPHPLYPDTEPPVYYLRVGERLLAHLTQSRTGGYMAAVHCVMARVQWHPSVEEAMRDVESVIHGRETEEVAL